MRVVLDTNIVVSGVFWHSGPPYQIIQQWLSGKITVIVSSEILDEYRRLVKRLSEKKGIDVSKLMERLLMLSELVFPINLVSGICTDPDDDKFLAIAVPGRAKFIVTGDRALLNVKRFRRTKIVTPAAFCRVLRIK